MVYCAFPFFFYILRAAFDKHAQARCQSRLRCVCLAVPWGWSVRKGSEVGEGKESECEIVNERNNKERKEQTKEQKKYPEVPAEDEASPQKLGNSRTSPGERHSTARKVPGGRLGGERGTSSLPSLEQRWGEEVCL